MPVLFIADCMHETGVGCRTHDGIRSFAIQSANNRITIEGVRAIIEHHAYLQRVVAGFADERLLLPAYAIEDTPCISLIDERSYALEGKNLHIDSHCLVHRDHAVELGLNIQRGAK